MLQKPAFHVSFVAVRPNRTRQGGMQILDLLTAQGGIYVPEEAEVWKEKESFETRKFSPEIIETLIDEWQRRQGPLRGFRFHRWKPYQTSLNASLTDFSGYDSLFYSVERRYLLQPGKLQEFLDFGKKFYNLLSPVFGDIGSVEMRRKLRRGAVEFLPGMNLFKQGLPDFEWAVFFGPEYVELFGREKVFKAPCHRVEPLSDGGALLLLTETPFEFDTDPGAFNRKRDSLRTYLGLDAFYMDDEHLASRFPKFRFREEREALIKEHYRKVPILRQLTPEEVQNQESWITNIPRTSDSFRTKMQSRGYTLDYSESSLGRLEDYLSSVILKDNSNEELEQEAGAYLGLTLQMLFGGQWTIDHVFRTPALDLPKPGESSLSKERGSSDAMKLSFEPGIGDAPDAIAFEKMVRTWPVSRIHRYIRSANQRGMLGYYVDAIGRALNQGETGLIRTQGS